MALLLGVVLGDLSGHLGTLLFSDCMALLLGVVLGDLLGHLLTLLPRHILTLLTGHLLLNLVLNGLATWNVHAHVSLHIVAFLLGHGSLHGLLDGVALLGGGFRALPDGHLLTRLVGHLLALLGGHLLALLHRLLVAFFMRNLLADLLRFKMALLSGHYDRYLLLNILASLPGHWSADGHLDGSALLNSLNSLVVNNLVRTLLPRHFVALLSRHVKAILTGHLLNTPALARPHNPHGALGGTPPSVHPHTSRGARPRTSHWERFCRHFLVRPCTPSSAHPGNSP